MVYGDCPYCGASYGRLSPCQCDLHGVALRSQQKFTLDSQINNKSKGIFTLFKTKK